MKVNVIIPAGGSGTRAAMQENKLLVNLDGKPLIEHTLMPFVQITAIERIVIPCRADDRARIKTIIDAIPHNCEIVLCPSGETRSESVNIALKNINPDYEITLIHDGARPYIENETILKCIDEAAKYGSAICALPSTDTVAVVDDGEIVYIPERKNCYSLQTPQGFKTEEILRAYNNVSSGNEYTDDSGVYSDFIRPAHIFEGKRTNKKITYAEDFKVSKSFRVGCGYDTHELVEGRKLILGGVEIPHSKGLLGHSDADVVTHAIMDAILTACDERDIGIQFPDSDDKYKDADSIELMNKVISLVNSKGYVVNNIAAVIMCQSPKLASYIPKMKEKIATTAKISDDKVSLSATTTEGLGMIGREEGIAVNAICSCYKD